MLRTHERSVHVQCRQLAAGEARSVTGTVERSRSERVTTDVQGNETRHTAAFVDEKLLRVVGVSVFE